MLRINRHLECKTCQSSAYFQIFFLPSSDDIPLSHGGFSVKKQEGGKGTKINWSILKLFVLTLSSPPPQTQFTRLFAIYTIAPLSHFRTMWQLHFKALNQQTTISWTCQKKESINAFVRRWWISFASQSHFLLHCSIDILLFFRLPLSTFFHFTI